MAAATRCFAFLSLSRISVAAFGSLYFKAAVLCAPMKSALIVRSSTMSLRNSATSRMTKAAQASSKAALLVSMMMTISFCLRETSRRKRMLSFLVRMFDLNNLREAQQFRTDLQPRLLSGVQVDFKLQAVAIVEEIDDPAGADKRFSLAHRQDTRAFERFENQWQIILL